MTFFQWLLSWFRKPTPIPTPLPINNSLVVVINQIRTANKLTSLISDPSLTKLAQTWAQTIADNEVLTHGDFAGRINQIYPNTAAAENIAEGQSNPSDVVSAWLNDPPHRANLLGPYTHVGTGQVNKFWVADFVHLS